MKIKSSNAPDQGKREPRKSDPSRAGVKKQTPPRGERASGRKKITVPPRTIEFLSSEIQAREVFLSGDFNAWEPRSFPLKKKSERPVGGRGLSGPWTV